MNSVFRFKCLVPLFFIFILITQPLGYISNAFGIASLKFFKDGQLFEYTPLNPMPYGSSNDIVSISGTIDRVIDCREKSGNIVGIKDFLGQYSDVYVTSQKDLSGSSTVLRDVSGTPNTIGGLRSLSFDDEPVAILPPVGKGLTDGSTYTIVFDHCQDNVFGGEFTDDKGILHVAEDDKFENAFKVDMGIRDIFLINLDAAQNVKKGAAEALILLNKLYAQQWISVMATKTAFKNWAGAHCLAQASTLITTPGGAAAADNLKIACGVALDALLMGLQSFLLSKVAPLSNAIKNYKALVADPPDFNYGIITPLILNKTLDLKTEDPLFSSIVETGNQINNEASIVSSLVSSLEKFQGSQIIGDPKGIILQANQIKNYANLLIEQLQLTDQAILKENIFWLSTPGLNQSDIESLKLLQKRISTNGLNSEELMMLKIIGFNENQIQSIKTNFQNIDFDTISDNKIIELNQNLTDAHSRVKQGLLQISNEVNTIINDIKQQYPYLNFTFPIANAGSPYIGYENTPITFEGSLSNNTDLIVNSYDWDLDGDGEFDDGNGKIISHIYDSPFTGYVGLKITTGENGALRKHAIDYTPVNITSKNINPIIESFLPNNTDIKILSVNNPQLFSVIASNPDGNQLEYEWSIDGVPINIHSNEFLYTPSTNELGFHKILVNITDDDSGYSPQYWDILVLSKDNDGDIWTENVDCNDSNPNINPGVQEIRYNGIDDDCNPRTLDTNTPPVAKNATIAVDQNGIRTIALSSPSFSSDVDNDVLTYEIVKGPVNGTLGLIKVNPFNNRIVTVDYKPNPNFHGKDSFTFIAKDQFAQSNVAKMSINVGILQIPTAVDRTVTVIEDTPTEIELRGISPDGHPLTFVLEGTRSEGTKGQPALGTIKNITQTSPTTANITYIPPSDFNNDISTRSDSIAFAVKDGEPVPGFEGREIDRGGITIKFTGVNDAPQPYNNFIPTQKDTPVSIELRASDADNDFFIRNPVLNNGITFSIGNQPSHGTLSSISSQLISIGQQPLPVNQTIDTITYTPEPGFIGQDSFSFIASDGVLDSTEGVITINVKDPNEALSKEFEDGDVIVGLTGCIFDCIEWHKADGTLVKNMAPVNIFGSHTGGDFDSKGNLYVTTFGRISAAGNNDGIQIFNSSGAYVGGLKDKNDFGCLDFTDPSIPHFGSPCMSPESIVFDKSGNMYVGGIATAEGDPRFPNDLRDAIRKFDPNGNLLAVYDVKIEDRGSDWIELAPDQCTMYYTSEDIHIKRYNVCTNQQLEDFSNVYGPGRSWDKVVGPPFPNYALRLLPSGDMLVASHNEIWRLDGEGNLIQKYDARGIEGWFALNLDPDGKSFWSARLGGAQSEIYRFDIETGKILQFFKTKPNIGPSGIYVKGEPKISSIEIPPTVQSMLLVTNTNNPLEVNLTGSDIANDPLNFSIVEQPKFGTLSDDIIPISNNVSKVVYTPNPDFNGTDSFTFIANDGILNSNNTGTIMITRNHAPIANNDGENDGINTLQGIPVNIDILANDNDVDVNNPILNDTLTIENIDTSETLGNVTLNNNNNTINYVPFAPKYIGQDSFNYTITDRYGLIDTAKVTVNVLSVNNIPVANNQTTETLENTTKTIQLIATDVDPQDNLFYQISSGPSNGFISEFNSTTGLAKYHPFRAFHGEDSFTFNVHDAKDKSLPGIVNITVIDDGINDAPKVESERVSANISQQITIDILENDIDPNGDFMTLTNITGPFNGTAFVNQDQTITYQSDPDFNASDVLYYRVADQFGKFDIGQLIIDVQGNADTQIIQVPSDRLVTTTRDQPLDIKLDATATIDRPVSFFIVDVPENGTLGKVTTLSNLSATVNYIPNNGFVGADSFTYIAIDDKGVVSNIGSIQISIDDIPRNSPVARDGLVMLDEDTSIPIQLNASDSDVNDVLTYSIESQPISGKILSFDSSTGSLVYKPNTNFNGNDGFLFKAVDRDGLESDIATVLITVNPVNDPPVANNQQVETDQNTPLQIALSGADPIDNDVISQFRIVSSPTNGQISTFNQLTGELTYTPNNNFFGNDSFTFKVIDTQGLESIESAAVSINVKEVTSPPVNNPPVAVDKTIETNNNTSVRITLEGRDIDQGDTINSFTIISNPTNGQISNFNANAGTLTYTPNNNFVGQDSFTFKVTDSRGLESTNTGLVTINVNSTQQPPNNEQPPLPLPSSVCTDSDNNSVKPKGTQGNDDLVGTSQRDTITGLGGNDRINGCSGDDTLNGNSGNDGIAGGPNDDNLHGNENNDYLQGDSGSDSLYGNEGNDILVGNEGRDRFFCGSGDDTILDFDYPLDVKSNDCE